MATASGQDANIAGRVRAAAQLVLQDLDPEARKRRQDFMSANPRVCLCLHVKKVRSFSKAFFNTSSFSGVQEFMMYVKITVGEISKVTKPTEVRKESNEGKRKTRKMTLAANQKTEKVKSNIADGTAEIVIDQVKAFSQEVSRRKDSSMNVVSFELLNIESATTRTIEAQAEKAVRIAAGVEEKAKKVTMLGLGEFHLWELINESQGEKTVTFRFKEQKVCEMDLEFICKYGSLGYGYSHQLYGLNDKSPQERVQDSVFFRLPGLDSRNGCDDCLLPCHIGRPALMDGANKEDVEIGSPIVRAQLWNLSEDSACFLTENTEQCVYLTRLIEKRGRLPRLKAELKTKPHRHERIEFLKQHVLRDTSKKDGSKHQGQSNDETIPDLQRRKSEVVKNMLENVTPLIEISDGINTRKSRSRGRNYNQTELDSGNFGQTGSNHADLLGVDQLQGHRPRLQAGPHKRNLSTISNTGYFNTDYGMDPPLEQELVEEDDDENQKYEASTSAVRQTLLKIGGVATQLKSFFGWNKTVPIEESEPNYSDSDSSSY